MIAIKGAEMPKHCMTCQFHDQMYNLCNIGHFETGAKFIKGDDKWYFKHPSCPLKEIITCGECYHCKKRLVEGVEYLQCNRDGSDTDKDGYCDYGERKE